MIVIILITYYAIKNSKYYNYKFIVIVLAKVVISEPKNLIVNLIVNINIMNNNYKLNINIKLNHIMNI